MTTPIAPRSWAFWTFVEKAHVPRCTSATSPVSTTDAPSGEQASPVPEASTWSQSANGAENAVVGKAGPVGFPLASLCCPCAPMMWVTPAGGAVFPDVIATSASTEAASPS
jgi:hypothetical protein